MSRDDKPANPKSTHRNVVSYDGGDRVVIRSEKRSDALVKIVDEIVSKYKKCVKCGATGEFFDRCGACGEPIYTPKPFDPLPINPISEKSSRQVMEGEEDSD